MFLTNIFCLSFSDY